MAVETNVKLEDLKSGDTVVLSHEGIVSSVNKYSGHVRLKDGARIRMTNGKGYDSVTDESIKFTANVIERAKQTPAFWPPEAGQVWKDGSGKKYFIIGGIGGTKAYREDDVLILIEKLAEIPGIHKVFG